MARLGAKVAVLDLNMDNAQRVARDIDGIAVHCNVADEASNPMALLQDHRMREALVAAIKNLPEREQFVMSMYYEHDMNLKEIAAVLKVTESRVCQLHSQSIARLRVKLRDW